MVTFSKRDVLAASLMATVGASVASRGQSEPPSRTGDTSVDIPAGRFAPTMQSLSQYQTPDWFRDAKFGIWAHWGPQAVPGQGDWYARFMYVPGHPHYDHHLKTYGHPSEFGYKDLIRTGRRTGSIPMRS